MDATIFLFLLQDGIINGSVYALVALALVLVFTVTRVILIPQGEFITFATLTVASLEAGRLPGTVWLLLALGVLAAASEIVQHRREMTIARIVRILAMDFALPAGLVAITAVLAPLKLGPAMSALLTLFLITPMGPMIYRIAFDPIREIERARSADRSVRRAFFPPRSRIAFLRSGRCRHVGLGDVFVRSRRSGRDRSKSGGCCRHRDRACDFRGVLRVVAVWKSPACLCFEPDRRAPLRHPDLTGRTAVLQHRRSARSDHRNSHRSVDDRLLRQWIPDRTERLRRCHPGRSRQLSVVRRRGIGGWFSEALFSFWASSFKEVLVFSLIIPVLMWRSFASGPGTGHN